MRGRGTCQSKERFKICLFTLFSVCESWEAKHTAWQRGQRGHGYRRNCISSKQHVPVAGALLRSWAGP